MNNFIDICAVDDILDNAGVCAEVDGAQVAVFRVGSELYAVDNHDPLSGANVLSRGLVCSIAGRITVASPIYKQHFDLQNGECLEDEAVRLQVWNVQQHDGRVLVEQRLAVAA